VLVSKSDLLYLKAFERLNEALNTRSTLILLVLYARYQHWQPTMTNYGKI